MCVELLNLFNDWLKNKSCPHYFVNDCSLIHTSLDVQIITSHLESISESRLSTWFIDNYLRKCAQLCHDRVSGLFDDVSTNMKLQNAVSAVVEWRLHSAVEDLYDECVEAEHVILCHLLDYSLTPHSCAYWITTLAKIDEILSVFITAVAFLHVANKITEVDWNDNLVAAAVGKFVADMLYLESVYWPECLQLTQRYKSTMLSAELSTTEIIELLQQSAVHHLATYRQRQAQKFSSVVTIVTTDFEALYAYKRGDYQQCLQLSTENVHTLMYAKCMPTVLIFPEFIQLLDDDIVSLTALTVIVNPNCRSKTDDDCTEYYRITQLTLSLHLMTQCQLRMHHSVKHLSQTLSCIKLARKRVAVNAKSLDHLTLKFTERKAMVYLASIV